MKSYILGRMIDSHIQSNETFDKGIITQSIRRAEWELGNLDFNKDIETPMKEAGWSLDFLYLDNNENRFELFKQEQELELDSEEQEQSSI